MVTQVVPGIYRMRDGRTACVWDKEKNMLGEVCWRGTIPAEGMCTWDDQGKDLAGYERCELVELVQAKDEDERRG